MSGSELVDNQISLVKYVPFNCLAIVFQPSLLNMSISLHIFVTYQKVYIYLLYKTSCSIWSCLVCNWIY